MNAKEQILTKVLNCRRSDLYLKERKMNDQEFALAQQMLERFEQGEPLQYILGDVSFYNVMIQVNKHVLIPRFETEILVDQAVQTFQNQSHVSLIDLGTGSGCIAIALAKALPQARIFAVDISSQAIALAKANAAKNGVIDQIAFVCEDMRHFLSDLAGQIPVFDGVISNPPYIATKEIRCLPADVRREPLGALDGGEDGCLFYRIIMQHLPYWVKEGGWCFFEMGETQKDILTDLFDQSPVTWKTAVMKDYTDADRILQAQWVEDYG